MLIASWLQGATAGPSIMFTFKVEKGVGDREGTASGNECVLLNHESKSFRDTSFKVLLRPYWSPLGTGESGK